MDRFIVIENAIIDYIKINLKSSMDRFIERQHQIQSAHAQI